ncbi:MAG TPA: symmetrical bis(5'-nucleosyl)-tetraphosphatase [Burkholderiaceae bacterium]|nr:symmetrical bis(5'-nucleosyl)-tetraphosphatase [Burkholderiaceae bacterium]
MATYAIGDIQGCFDALQRLLGVIGFDATRDRLWLVGDLVNRGTQSLATLRFARSLGERAITVLGNHDLHLLMVAEGLARAHRSDTIDDVLAAPDRDELIGWLRSQPMMHVEGGYAMVHAGLLPQWSVPRALELAREVETALRGPRYREFMAAMYGNRPDRWDEGLTGNDRLRVLVNAMTRMRLCTSDGVMEFSHKTGLDGAPAGFVPWFDVPNRASLGATVVCGHWAALGLLQRPDLLALDSGCVWGRQLSAVRLEDRRLYQITCKELEGLASEP